MMMSMWDAFKHEVGPIISLKDFDTSKGRSKRFKVLSRKKTFPLPVEKELRFLSAYPTHRWTETPNKNEETDEHPNALCTVYGGSMECGMCDGLVPDGCVALLTINHTYDPFTREELARLRIAVCRDCIDRNVGLTLYRIPSTALQFLQGRPCTGTCVAVHMTYDLKDHA